MKPLVIPWVYIYKAGPSPTSKLLAFTCQQFLWDIPVVVRLRCEIYNFTQYSKTTFQKDITLTTSISLGIKSLVRLYSLKNLALSNFINTYAYTDICLYTYIYIFFTQSARYSPILSICFIILCFILRSLVHWNASLFFFTLFVHLFLAVLGLCCSVDFSLLATSRGRLLTAASSLVAEHGL